MTTSPRRKAIQAKDIPDDRMMMAVVKRMGMYWATTWDVAEEFPDAPLKVARAKLRQLGKRGLLSGCGDHECRGDWELTAKGREYLAAFEAEG